MIPTLAAPAPLAGNPRPASTPTIRARLVASLILTFTLAGAASAAAPSLADDPEVQGAIRLFEARLRGQMAYRGLPGIAVGVVHDQQLIWARGYGHADLSSQQPVTPTTKFRMASHSKLFTATAVMQLRDAGKLRLDDPVVKHLPWFTPKPAQPDDPPITVEDLLTHGSGLPREAGPHWSTLEFPDAAALRRYVAEHPAVFAADVRWKYSNLALAIAGQLVETLSGEKFADYVPRHIFQPLGMNDSSVDQKVAGLATGYGRRMPDGSRQPMPFVDARALGAATGVTSTVADMAKFVSAQFRSGPVGGSQILSTGALRQMHRVRFLENDWTRGYAIGFSVERMKDKNYIGHGGSYPGYKTHTLIQIDSKVGVIVLTNGDDSVPSDFAAYLMSTVGEAVAKAASPAPKRAEWDPSWSRFAGLYRSIWGDSEVVELHRRLVMIDPLASNPDAQVQLIPIGGGKFRFEASSGGSVVGEIVRFEEKDGRVVRMYTGDSFADRVNP